MPARTGTTPKRGRDAGDAEEKLPRSKSRQETHPNSTGRDGWTNGVLQTVGRVGWSLVRAPMNIAQSLWRQLNPLPSAPTRGSGVEPKDEDRLTSALKMRIRVDGKDPLEQLDDHIIHLLALRGTKKDKSTVPCLATSGIAGSGKTEFLLHLCENWDTFASQTCDPQNAQSHLQHLNGMLPTGSPALSHLVVLFATYNQDSTTMFHPKHDTAETIETRLMFRLAHDYYGDASLANGFWSTHDFLAAVRSTVDPVHPEGVGVLLCVDELMKMTGGLDRLLLDHLAAVQQAELRNRLPTFSLVTSLSLWPVANQWVTQTKRSLSVVDLPMLPIDKVKDMLIKSYNSRTPSRSEAHLAQWEEFVSATLDSTGGHPRTLGEAYFHIKDFVGKDPTKWTEVEADNLTFETASALWTEVLAKQIATRKPVRVRADALSRKSNEEEPSTLYQLTVIDSLVMTEPVPVQDQKRNVFKLDLTAIPQSFMTCEYPSVIPSTAVFHPQWVSILHEALWTLSDLTAYKTWEQGMVAALALTAKALLDTNRRVPTLQEVLPEAQFSHSDLKKWRVDVSVRRELIGARTTAALWPSVHDDGTHVFHRYSQNPSQEAVEGSLELLTQDDARAVGWSQNKLYNKTKPGQTKEWIDEVHTFHEKQFPSVPHRCLILFCTGDTAGCFEKVLARYPKGVSPMPVVFVGSKGCERLLAPFGASVLRKKFENRLRQPSSAPVKGNK